MPSLAWAPSRQEKLIQALQELQPPEDQQDDQQQDQGDQQQDQQQDDGSQDQQPNEPDDQQQQQQMDPSRILQAVRDREAQRRKDQEQRVMAGQAPVEKDW